MRVTRQRFDPAGRMFATTDPRLANANRSIVYSLGGNALATESVDAGWRVALFGEAGQVLHGWDGRGTERQLEYDLLLRPARIIEQNAARSCSPMARQMRQDTTSAINWSAMTIRRARACCRITACMGRYSVKHDISCSPQKQRTGHQPSLIVMSWWSRPAFRPVAFSTHKVKC